MKLILQRRQTLYHSATVHKRCPTHSHDPVRALLVERETSVAMQLAHMHNNNTSDLSQCSTPYNRHTCGFDSPVALGRTCMRDLDVTLCPYSPA